MRLEYTGLAWGGQIIALFCVRWSHLGKRQAWKPIRGDSLWTSTLQRWLKVWRSRVSACAGAVKPPSTGRPTKGEADTPLLDSAMRHSQHALGAPPRRNAVRPRLRARGFSRRTGGQSQYQRRPSGLPGCLARTRSSRRCRRGLDVSGWRGCPAPPVSPRSSR